jgi:hypothetical protein
MRPIKFWGGKHHRHKHNRHREEGLKEREAAGDGRAYPSARAKDRGDMRSKQGSSNGRGMAEDDIKNDEHRDPSI